MTAASQLRGLLNQSGWRVDAHLHSVGDLHSKPLFLLDRNTELPEDSTMARLNCRDEQAAESFSNFIEEIRMDQDSIGSSVECIIEGLPIGWENPGSMV